MITVKELIAELKKQDPDAPVFYSYDYGDHIHTRAAEPVRRIAAREVVEWSYGNCHRVVDPHDEDESVKDLEGAIRAVVLK